MPTFTTIALENLLEPRVRDSSLNKKLVKSADITENPRPAVDSNDNNDGKRRGENVSAPKHIYISPALYTTPEPAPITEVSSEYPSSPSPYIVNHKGRGGGNVGRRIGGHEASPPPEEERKGNDEEGERDLNFKLGDEEVEDNFWGVEVENEGFIGEESENNGFLDPVSSFRFETESVGSVNEEAKGFRGAESHSFVSAQGEFFDANEEFSSDGSISSSLSNRHNHESELRAIKLSLLEEIERRNTAEDTLKLMQNQWKRIGNLLAQVGLTFPALPNAGSVAQLDSDSLEQLTQEIIVARFVAEAMGKGEAHAEAELAAQAILESKDLEISRLRDRLQYYEAVNREMSQRNQEIVEVARRQRQRRNRQQKWLWSCIGLSVAVGASMVAYTYLPCTSKQQPLPSSGDLADGSCISSSETA